MSSRVGGVGRPLAVAPSGRPYRPLTRLAREALLAGPTFERDDVAVLTPRKPSTIRSRRGSTGCRQFGRVPAMCAAVVVSSAGQRARSPPFVLLDVPLAPFRGPPPVHLLDDQKAAEQSVESSIPPFSVKCGVQTSRQGESDTQDRRNQRNSMQGHRDGPSCVDCARDKLEQPEARE